LLLLVISGNIHPHPSPTFDNLSICHINCRSLLAFDKEAKCNTMELEEIESVLCTGKFEHHGHNSVSNSKIQFYNDTVEHLSCKEYL
jgi:hypothetical protein